MLAAPVVVLTTIGLEHTEVLGDTRELIFAEKAAVIAPGADVVFGPLDGPRGCGRAGLRRARARAHFVGRDVVVAGGPASFSVELEGERFGALAVPTPASYQTVNAGLAVAACRLLLGGLDDRAVRRALAGTAVPGRLQIAGREPLVVADGAHNPHGVTALVEALAGLSREAPRVGVFAIMADKAVDEMLDLLLPLVETVVCTQASESRSLTAALLARRVDAARGHGDEVEGEHGADGERERRAEPVRERRAEPVRERRAVYEARSPGRGRPRPASGRTPRLNPDRGLALPAQRSRRSPGRRRGRGWWSILARDLATSREAQAMARGSSSLIVRLLLWLLFLVAAAVVAFFVGYLIGPYVVTHVL